MRLEQRSPKQQPRRRNAERPAEPCHTWSAGRSYRELPHSPEVRSPYASSARKLPSQMTVARMETVARNTSRKMALSSGSASRSGSTEVWKSAASVSVHPHCDGRLR